MPTPDPTIERQPDGLVRKETIAAAPSGNPLEYIMSDDSVDRMGDIIDPAGWQLSNFRKNPIALFGHRSDFVIGNWRNVKVSGNQLVGQLELLPPVSDRLRELHAAIGAGVLRAVSVGFRPMPDQMEPVDPKDPMSGWRFLRSELLECSIVAVPANPNAMQMAKELNLSGETMSLIFGKTANEGHVNRAEPTGKSASTSLNPSQPRRTKMTTLAQRIEDAQNDLNAKRDKLAELNNADDLDLDAIEELNSQLELVERELAARKASEAKIGLNAAAAVAAPVTAPAIVRRPFGVRSKDIDGFDLLVRAMTARGVSHFSGRSLDRVLDERYPGHEATAIVAKADQTVGTTTVTGWAVEIAQTVYGDFMQALVGYSVFPDLRARGIGLNFDGNGTVSIPSRTIGGAGGGFVAEGSPIRVGRITTAALTITPRKLGVIVPFSRELAKRSTPAIEGLVRQAILEDTSVVLDAALLDATAVSTARPAGLLNGVAATAVGFGGGDATAVIADFQALLAPFYAANAADNITVIMNPAQLLALSMMPGPGLGNLGWSGALTSRLHIVESTHATAGRLIAVRNSDFATALGDAPEFDVSEQATVHMEDTTPLEIVATAPTTADPVRSFFQTATIGVRMLMDVSWTMRRSGMVSWINGTTW